MHKIIIIIIIFLLLSNCQRNPVINTHGVPFLDIKQKNLIIKKTNKNDVKKILGHPSTVAIFDNSIWIYIERKTTKGSLITLGKKKMLTNNVLILEIDDRGLLSKKDFFDINDMNELDFSSDSTEKIYTKKSFIYDFLASMRQKINDPLGKRKK